MRTVEVSWKKSYISGRGEINPDAHIERLGLFQRLKRRWGGPQFTVPEWYCNSDDDIMVDIKIEGAFDSRCLLLKNISAEGYKSFRTNGRSVKYILKDIIHATKKSERLSISFDNLSSCKRVRKQIAL